MNGLSKDEAERCARKAIAKIAASSGKELALLTNQTITREKAWIFFFDSKRFVDTGDRNARLFGNGPVVVEKLTGEVIAHDSRVDLDALLESYGAEQSEDECS